MALLQSGTRIFGTAIIDTQLSITGTTISVSSTTGALVVGGGVGVGGQLNVGQTVTAVTSVFYGDATGNGALYAGVTGYTPFAQTMIQATGNYNGYMEFNAQNINTGTQASTDIIASADNVTANSAYVDMGITGSKWNGSQQYSLGTALGPNDGYLMLGQNFTTGTGNLTLGTTTLGTSIKFVVAATGTVVTTASIAMIVNPVNTTATSTLTGTLVVYGGAGIAGNLYVGGNIVAQQLTIQYTTITTTLITTPDVFTITNTTQASSTVSGALVVSGGVGVGGNLFVGNNAVISGTSVLTGAVTATNNLSVGSNFTVSGITTLVGNASIGTGSSVAFANLTINGLIGGGASAWGQLNNGVVTTIAVNTGGGYASSVVLGTAVTTTNLWHFFANPGPAGTGSSASTHVGFFANSTIGQLGFGATTATLSAGFYGAVASGTGTYNLYMAGSAPNYFASTITSVSTVAASSTLTGALILRAGAGIGGSLYIGGNTTAPPIVINSSTLAATPIGGGIEYDGNNFYGTGDTGTGSGRQVFMAAQMVKVATTSNVASGAPVFGITNRPNLQPGSTYRFSYQIFYTKQTAGNITFTFTGTNSPSFLPLNAVVTTVQLGVVGSTTASNLTQITAYGAATTSSPTSTLTAAVSYMTKIEGMVTPSVNTRLTLNANQSAGSFWLNTGSNFIIYDISNNASIGNIG